jgi:hypothetical protein
MLFTLHSRVFVLECSWHSGEGVGLKSSYSLLLKSQSFKGSMPRLGTSHEFPSFLRWDRKVIRVWHGIIVLPTCVIRLWQCLSLGEHGECFGYISKWLSHTHTHTHTYHHTPGRMRVFSYLFVMRASELPEGKSCECCFSRIKEFISSVLIHAQSVRLGI